MSLHAFRCRTCRQVLIASLVSDIVVCTVCETWNTFPATENPCGQISLRPLAARLTAADFVMLKKPRLTAADIVMLREMKVGL